MDYEEVIEKNDSPKTDMDIINKNLNTNGNHSKYTGIIIKDKKIEEFENIKSEKIIGKSIECLYILKDIFSFLSQKKKLEIIIYNKELQKILDINIEDYKRKARIYRIGERNGKGKEYYSSGKLRFEGEYLNGKRNGKGKEYNRYGDLIFEGEYLNGKRWNGKGYNKEGKIELEIKEGNGKGKEYDYYGFKFEGEYLNGKRNGKGKEYYDNGKLLFEGEYLNGERNGKGKEYDYHGLKFEGEYLNGKRNGKGKEYYDDGELEFEGEY